MSTTLWPEILLPSTAAANVETLATLSAADWEWLATAAHCHGLAPLLYANLQSLPLAPSHAGPALEKLRAAYKHSLLTAMRREAELRRILDGLAAQGICPGLFKGAALAYTIYPTPGCRPMGDIDLWVTHAEMPAAIDVLGELGYRFHEKADRPHAMTQSTDGEVQMRPTQPGQQLVELHWGVFAGEWLARTTAIDRTGVRSRLVHTTLTGGREVLLLAPEDALIQLAVHLGVNHQMSLNALRSLVDIALLAQQRPVDWDVVVQRARAWRVATVVGLVLALADACFSLPALTVPATTLAPRGVQKKLLARFVTKQTILARPDLATQKSRFAYLLCATDRPRDSVHLLLRTLWPEPAWVAARYGQADMRTRLHHAAGALRGDI